MIEWQTARERMKIPMKRYVKSMEEVYAFSMSRILQHLKEDNIATLTSFITANDAKRPENKTPLSRKQNEKRNKELGNALREINYGYAVVDGYYTQESQEEPVYEISYFVISPKGHTLDQFTKDMINLARRYEQVSVVVWDYKQQKARLYETEDYKSYKNTFTFNNFTIDNVRKITWTQYKKNWLRFEGEESGDDTAVYTVENAESAFDSKYDPTTPCHRIAAKRYEMFGEYY